MYQWDVGVILSLLKLYTVFHFFLPSEKYLYLYQLIFTIVCSITPTCTIIIFKGRVISFFYFMHYFYTFLKFFILYIFLHFVHWTVGLGQMYLVLFSVQDYFIKTVKVRKTPTLRINVTVVTVVCKLPPQHHWWNKWQWLSGSQMPELQKPGNCLDKKVRKLQHQKKKKEQQRQGKGLQLWHCPAFEKSL